MKLLSVAILTTLSLSVTSWAENPLENYESPSEGVSAFPELSKEALARAEKKEIEFRNGDHDDPSKILVTIYDGRRAQISCVNHFVVGTDSPEVRKIQNGYPFSREDLENRAHKWFFGSTRILGENAELMRKIASYMGPEAAVTGEHREIFLSNTSMYDRCLKLEEALRGASTHSERQAFNQGTGPSYSASTASSKVLREPLSTKSH